MGIVLAKDFYDALYALTSAPNPVKVGCFCVQALIAHALAVGWKLYP